MILRQSNRALSETIARANLRCAELWADLDAVQLEISELTTLPSDRTPTGEWFSMDEFRTLANREREILAQLDRLDD